MTRHNCVAREVGKKAEPVVAYAWENWQSQLAQGLDIVVSPNRFPDSDVPIMLVEPPEGRKS